MKQTILYILAFASATTAALNAQVNVKNTKDTLQEWVETRQITSEEKTNWEVEQSILGDTVELLNRELKRLTTELEEVEASTTETDEERAQLTEEKQELTAASSVVEAHIGELEAQMKRVIKTLPGPLLEKIKPLIRRFPKDPSDTSLSLGERVQNIVGILSQADKFNTTITQTSESREVESGKTVEVRTLYWGLATAYYVDASSEYAGIGHPTPEGWEWPRMDQAGPAIKRLIDVYEGSEDIQFVTVPAKIK